MVSESNEMYSYGRENASMQLRQCFAFSPSSRHIHIFTVSVHRKFKPTQHSEITVPSLSEKGEGGLRWGLLTTRLSSWHHCKQTPDMAVVCPL